MVGLYRCVLFSCVFKTGGGNRMSNSKVIHYYHQSDDLRISMVIFIIMYWSFIIISSGEPGSSFAHMLLPGSSHWKWWRYVCPVAKSSNCLCTDHNKGVFTIQANHPWKIGRGVFENFEKKRGCLQKFPGIK